MPKESRLPLNQARAKAERLAVLLAPAIVRGQIAGSIRRERRDPGDIEFVCIPKVTHGAPVDLFSEHGPEVSLLDELVDQLLAEKILEHRLDVNGTTSCGRWAKRLLFEDFPLDVFCATPETWGVTLAIRTGDARFSVKLASQRGQGGLLPRGWYLRKWRLHNERGIALDTPEEADVFRALGLPHIHPTKRK